MDIVTALKDKRRELQNELARTEKALAALAGEKPVRANGNGHKKAEAKATPEAPASPGKLPDRITKLLAQKGALAVETIAELTVAPKQQVATTCSRLVRDGRLKKMDRDGTAVYSINGKHNDNGVSPFDGAS